jgi:hypothetical protein
MMMPVKKKIEVGNNIYMDLMKWKRIDYYDAAIKRKNKLLEKVVELEEELYYDRMLEMFNYMCRISNMDKSVTGIKLSKKQNMILPTVMN